MPVAVTDPVAADASPMYEMALAVEIHSDAPSVGCTNTDAPR